MFVFLIVKVKWQLMVTSCYRRLGDLYKALELYQKVRKKDLLKKNCKKKKRRRKKRQ